jgi:hypothetical protein
MADLVLDHLQRKALCDALLAAFPTPHALARLTAHRLGVNLSAVVSDGPLTDRVFDLVEWAGAQGRLGELVQAARAENPGNPKLLEFAAQHLGEDFPAPPAPRAPPEIPPGVAVDTTDPAMLARLLRKHLVWLYPLPTDAMRLASDAGLARGRIDLTGSPEVFWMNTLDEAARSGKLARLVAAARDEYPQDPALARYAAQLAGAPTAPRVEWTPTLMYDALLRLLPVQLEEVVFRLAVPSYYLPPPNAPVAERAQGLVRLIEQQSRLGELAALLDKMKLTPR